MSRSRTPPRPNCRPRSIGSTGSSSTTWPRMRGCTAEARAADRSRPVLRRQCRGGRAGRCASAPSNRSCLISRFTFSSRGRTAPLARAVSRIGGSPFLRRRKPCNKTKTPLAEMIGVDAAALLVDRSAVARSPCPRRPCAELCLIAGVPGEGRRVSSPPARPKREVRRTLIEARAAHSDATSIQSTITPMRAPRTWRRPRTRRSSRAVKKLIAKE